MAAELCPLCEEPLDDGRAVQTSLEGEVHHDCLVKTHMIEQVDVVPHGVSSTAGYVGDA